MTSPESSGKFAEICSHVLQVLRERIPLRCWMIVRAERDDAIVVAVNDLGYGVRRGHVFCWSDSLCLRMLRGEGPATACDTLEVAPYAQAPMTQLMPIRAYIGAPLRMRDGHLFGTIFGIDPEPQDTRLHDERAVLDTSARLLCAALESELDRTIRRPESAPAMDDAHRDALTRLPNRRGWQLLGEHAEQLYTDYASAYSLVHVELDDERNPVDSTSNALADQTLRRAAAVLCTHLRDGDLVARLDGDRFGILLGALDSLALERIMRKLRGALADQGISALLGGALRQHHVSWDATSEEAQLRMQLSRPRRNGAMNYAGTLPRAMSA